MSGPEDKTGVMSHGAASSRRGGAPEAALRVRSCRRIRDTPGWLHGNNTLKRPQACPPGFFYSFSAIDFPHRGVEFGYFCRYELWTSVWNENTDPPNRDRRLL